MNNRWRVMLLTVVLCLLLAGVAAGETALDLSGSGTVNITEGGTYHLNGSLQGQIVINVPGKRVDLVFYTVEIVNPEAPCILCEAADELTIHLQKGGQSRLVSGTLCELTAEAATEGEGAAIWADCDLNIKGSGSLEVGGYIHHGIQSVGDLKIKNGTITVEAVSQALRGRDSVTVSGGRLTLRSGADAIHVAKVKKEGKGFILVTGGSIDVLCGDDGMQAASDLTITGGEITIEAADKALKAEGTVTLGDGCRCTVLADQLEMEVDLSADTELPAGKVMLKFDK